MAQSKEFVDASHALNDLSHALALLESENASLRGAVDGLCNENVKLRELVADTLMQPRDYCKKYGIEYESWDSANDHLNARMRELGVEVQA